MGSGESSSTKLASSGGGPTPGIRKAFTTDESARSPANRFSAASETPSPGIRRRGSNFSDYSLSEARKNIQSSTDDILLPKPDINRPQTSNDSNAWHSAPLAFALLPAIGGIFFQNGSLVITDIMLLGLAAIFLNWSVRLPWDWYHSAQETRIKEEENGMIFGEESEDDNSTNVSQTTLDEVPEDEISGPTPTRPLRSSASKIAANELYTHEVLALLSCFTFPILGAYLLHTIRTQLSRPSEGLVSNYNLSIFLLASELRPMAHLAKLIQSRTLHLQRVVNSNPYHMPDGRPIEDVKDILRRVADLEARGFITEPTANIEPTLTGKQSAVIATEVRRTLQPDLDALNRAVRRYEKRATLQAFQTESRLLDLEARLADAISLAAAAANNGHRSRSFTAIIVEWVATAVVLPIQALGTIASLPFKTTAALIIYGKTKVFGGPPPEKPRKGNNVKYSSYGRSYGETRPSGRILKK